MLTKGCSVEYPKYTNIEKDFAQPQDIDKATMLFPAGVVGTLLPDYKDLPEEFKDHNNPWCMIVQHMFFNGGEGVGFAPREDVDPDKAFDHFRACLGSFEPKHQHKEAGCAYLLSRWFHAARIEELDLTAGEVPAGEEEEVS